MIVPHRYFTPIEDTSALLLRWLSDKKARSEAIEVFEKTLEEKLGVGNAIAVNSARHGLYLALKAMNLPSGSTIWLPVNTYDGLVKMLEETGYNIGYIDIENDFNISPDTLEYALKGFTDQGVVVATHMFGLPCDVKNLISVADKYGLSVLEDCAHAFYVQTPQGFSGSIGEAGIFSFQARKAVNALSGGVLVTNNAALAEKIRDFIDAHPDPTFKTSMRLLSYFVEKNLMNNALAYPLVRQIFAKRNTYKKARRYYGRLAKFNRETGGRLSEISAMLANAQVRKISERHSRLAQKWKLYTDVLSSHSDYHPAPRKPGVGHGHYMYVMRAPDVKRLSEALWKRGVGSVYGEQFMPCLAKNDNEFPNFRRIQNHVLQLPFSCAMSDKEFEYVAEKLNDAILELG